MDKDYLSRQITENIKDDDKIFILRQRIVKGETEFYQLNLGFGIYDIKSQLIMALNKVDDKIRALEKK